MFGVYESINKEIYALLKRKSSLAWESPINVDQHDDDIDSIKKDIEVLLAVRTMIEERIQA